MKEIAEAAIETDQLPQAPQIVLVNQKGNLEAVDMSKIGSTMDSLSGSSLRLLLEARGATEYLVFLVPGISVPPTGQHPESTFFVYHEEAGQDGEFYTIPESDLSPEEIGEPFEAWMTGGFNERKRQFYIPMEDWRV